MNVNDIFRQDGYPHADDEATAPAPLTWETLPSGIERAVTETDGVYLLMRIELPGRDLTRYAWQVRHIDPDSVKAYGVTGSGYLVGERYSEGEARAHAESVHEFRSRRLYLRYDLPAEIPGVIARTDFHWPVKNLGRPALVIRKDWTGAVVAEVIGMGRHAGDEFRPGAYATVEVPR